MEDRAVAEALGAFDTPFYLFDEQVLQRTIEHLREGLPENASLCFAMKANPFVVAQAAHMVGRVEVCSPGEIRICQLAGVPAEKIVVSGVHKDAALMHELAAGDAAPCRYTVESVSQYELLCDVARQAGKRLPILVRLTSGNQFGVDAPTARDLVARAVGSPWLDLRGIQYFPGTQRTSARRLRRELGKVGAFVAELAREHELADLELEYGPGLPVEYFEQDASLARAQDDAQLEALCDALRELAGMPVVLEMGRAIAAACGTYVTRVVDAKRSKGQNYAIVDGGMHQLVYYGHAMSLRQPACHVFGAASPADDSAEPWNVYGSLCTTSDALAKQLPLGELRMGDALVFERAGAYCMTEGISLFLSRDLPRVLMRDRDGTIRLVRERFETYPLNTAGERNVL